MRYEPYRAYIVIIVIVLIYLLVYLSGCRTMIEYDVRTYEYDVDKSILVPIVECTTDWRGTLRCWT